MAEWVKFDGSEEHKAMLRGAIKRILAGIQGLGFIHIV